MDYNKLTKEELIQKIEELEDELIDKDSEIYEPSFFCENCEDNEIRLSELEHELESSRAELQQILEEKEELEINLDFYYEVVDDLQNVEDELKDLLCSIESIRKRIL